MPGEAELILFAIRTLVRLGGQARAAYVDVARARDVVLPLPDFRTTPRPHDAVEYFERGGGSRRRARFPRVGELLGREALTDVEQRELLTFYVDCLLEDRLASGVPMSDGGVDGLDTHAWTALLTIRQWRPGADPQPTLLRRAAGTLVEVGVDYFATVPGALDANSATGRALAGVLTGLQSVDFVAAFAPENMGRLPGRLLVAAFETVSAHPELLTGDRKVQALLEGTAATLAGDVKKRIDELDAAGRGDTDTREAVGAWAELVFRSVLSSGGRMVLAQPAVYLGIGDRARAALVNQVALDMLSFVLDHGALADAFSKEALDVVLEAAVRTVGQHPELAAGNRRLGALLGVVATQLAGSAPSPLTAALLPELTRIIVEQTGEHLDLLWPAGDADPKRHLLVAAMTTTLAVLSREPRDGAGKLRFGRDEILGVVQTAVDELVSNPGWLVAAAHDANANLGVAVEATVAVLRQRADARLDAKTGVEIVRAAIRAVARRGEFLETLPASARPVVAEAVDAVLAAVLDPGLPRHTAWQVVRSEIVVAMVHVALGELARVPIDAPRVAAVRGAMKTSLDAVKGQAFELDRFRDAVREALK